MQRLAGAMRPPMLPLIAFVTWKREAGGLCTCPLRMFGYRGGNWRYLGVRVRAREERGGVHFVRGSRAAARLRWRCGCARAWALKSSGPYPGHRACGPVCAPSSAIRVVWDAPTAWRIRAATT
eukprot:3500669-Prymnesium_polylepis.2